MRTGASAPIASEPEAAPWIRLPISKSSSAFPSPPRLWRSTRSRQCMSVWLVTGDEGRRPCYSCMEEAITTWQLSADRRDGQSLLPEKMEVWFYKSREGSKELLLPDVEGTTVVAADHDLHGLAPDGSSLNTWIRSSQCSVTMG